MDTMKNGLLYAQTFKLKSSVLVRKSKGTNLPLIKMLLTNSSRLCVKLFSKHYFFRLTKKMAQDFT